jgi:hypothetical protein
LPFKTFSVGDILTAADAMTYWMRQCIAVVTSASRPSSPVAGQTIIESDTGLTQRYDGAAWRPWPPVPVQFEELSNFSSTSTTYTAGSPQCSGTFISGPTGVAIVTVEGYIQMAAATNIGVLSFEIRLTNVSGAVFTAAADTNALQSQNVDNLQACYRTVITGMTPGVTYFARTMHRVNTAGTITINARRLIVEPWAN